MKTILISAYACEPGKGSEPGVGWYWSREISKNNKVIVLTRENNRDVIESELKVHPDPNIEFVYYDVPRSLSFWKKGQRGVQLYYLLWQIGAYRIAKRIVEKTRIDIVLALTFGNMWLPTLMHKLPCKFIWGPLGGGEGIPRILWNHISLKQRMYEMFRSINPRLPITNIWFRRACRKASAIIVRTNESLDCIPEKYKNKCSLMIETGVEETECKLLHEKSLMSGSTRDFAIIGRMVPFKLVDLGIRAFAAVSRVYGDIKLHVVGDGECGEKLKALAAELNIEDRIIFHGKLQREDSIRILSQCLALLMPSAREGGAWVLFEAMMCARPIICMDNTGMRMIVSSESGIKIPVCDYSKLVDLFKDAMIRLLQDENLADNMGKAGFKRVSGEFLWRDKGIYFERILSGLDGGDRYQDTRGT